MVKRRSQDHLKGPKLAKRAREDNIGDRPKIEVNIDRNIWEEFSKLRPFQKTSLNNQFDNCDCKDLTLNEIYMHGNEPEWVYHLLWGHDIIKSEVFCKRCDINITDSLDKTQFQYRCGGSYKPGGPSSHKKPRPCNYKYRLLKELGSNQVKFP